MKQEWMLWKTLEAFAFSVPLGILLFAFFISKLFPKPAGIFAGRSAKPEKARSDPPVGDMDQPRTAFAVAYEITCIHSQEYIDQADREAAQRQRVGRKS